MTLSVSGAELKHWCGLASATARAAVGLQEAGTAALDPPLPDAFAGVIELGQLAGEGGERQGIR